MPIQGCNALTVNNSVPHISFDRIQFLYVFAFKSIDWYPFKKREFGQTNDLCPFFGERKTVVNGVQKKCLFFCFAIGVHSESNQWHKPIKK